MKRAQRIALAVARMVQTPRYWKPDIATPQESEDYRRWRDRDVVEAVCRPMTPAERAHLVSLWDS